MKKRIVVTASVFGMLAVIAGAFGAHGLEGLLSPKNLEVWRTAVQYQFYHVFALLFLANLTRSRTRLVNDCYYLFSFGIIFFSGSLYLLSCRGLLGWSWLPLIGPVTPIGGLLFIGGWVTLGVAALRDKLSGTVSRTSSGAGKNVKN
jgi:uncharacterized membrane protein YgdD (TMEM256/DUF423 family)